MEEMSATSQQPASNQLLTDADFQLTSATGPRADNAAPLRGRKPKKKVPGLQKQEFDQEKDSVPVRPVRRTDSLTPEHKQNSEDSTIKFSPVHPAGKDINVDLISTKTASFSSCNIVKGDSSFLLSGPPKNLAQDTVKVTTYSGGYRQNVEAPISKDVDSPPLVKRGDGSYLAKTSETTAPSKPLRKKVCHNASKEDSVSKINDHQNLQAQISLKALEGSANVCQTPSEMIPVQPVENQITNTEQIIYDQKLSKKVNCAFVQDPCDETKRNENVAPTTETLHVNQPTSLSIIQRIRLPRGKRLKSSAAIQIKDPVMDDQQELWLTNIAGEAAVGHTGHGRRQESTFKASHEDTAQGKGPDGSSFITPSSEGLSKVQHKGHQPCVFSREGACVILRRRSLNTEMNVQGEDGGIPEKTPEFSGLPVPKPRTRKRLSGLFVAEDTNSATPASCLPNDKESEDKESDQQNEKLTLPVPLPRAKKRLSATYLESTQQEDGLLLQQNEVSQKNTEDTPISSKETTEGSTSLNSSVISEGGHVTIQGGGDGSSELEKEVLAAMTEEEFSHTDSTEDKEKALDEIIEGWTFTDKPGVTDHLEQHSISEQAEIEKVLGTEVDKLFAGDDWLHVVNDKDVEHKSRKEMRDEEVDFGFVSVDVAAGSLQDR